MPPELELVRQWLERASADLRAAKILATDTSLTSEVCFHGQQAVEKALKAYLTFTGIEFEYVHSIVYLLDLSAEGEGGFEQFRPSADALTHYAVRFRYPRSGPNPTPGDAREALSAAEQVVAYVLKRLPPQTHPAT
jgi:HEPN domain-containing protein